MQKLNIDFEGKLDTAIQIFKNEHPKKFLNQLVSSQLDMDRLDYLRRDSFFTGVSEGIIGVDRIIKMLSVVSGNLVVETKGIYSIEKFLVARRLMYWQVYLHKTVLSAEFMLVNILKRAKQLAHDGIELFATPVLREFLYSEYDMSMIRSDKTILEKFCELDDYDVLACIKAWKNHEDKVLSLLSSSLLNRKLFKIKLSSEKWSEKLISEMQHRISEKYELSPDEAAYFVIHDMVDNKAYSPASENILIKMKDGTVTDLALASDHLNISALSDPVQKWFLAEYL